MAAPEPLNQYQTAQPQLTAQASPSQPSGGLVASAMKRPSPSTYTPTTRDVRAEETVQGQVNSILSQSGPLFQRARSMAAEKYAGRGLVNSSMAIGAAQGAVMDRAIEIATPDAATYGRTASENMAARNQAGQFNADSENRFKLQASDQDFSAGESQKQRDFTAGEAAKGRDFEGTQNQLQRDFTSGENRAQREFQGSQAGLDRDQQLRLQQLQEAGVQNRFDQELAMRNRQFDVEQAATDRRMAQQHANTLEQLGFTNNLNKANVPSSFAATISTSTMDRVNAILGDPNLDPEAKKNAVQNVIDYANATLAWGETFYATPMPRINSPQAPATSRPSTPAPAQPDRQVQVTDPIRRVVTEDPYWVGGA